MKLRSNAGFTLLEIGIVLTIFGIIIAGVFLLVSTALQNQHSNRLSQQVISIVGNARNYASQVDTSTLNLAITDMDQLGLLPSDVSLLGSTNTNYVHAFGQQINACVAGSANALACSQTGFTNGMAVLLYNLPYDVCTNLVFKLGANAKDLGLVQYGTYGGGGYIGADFTLPTITNACAPPNNSNNPVGVELDFTL